jgi:hypothetical protein
MKISTYLIILMISIPIFSQNFFKKSLLVKKESPLSLPQIYRPIDPKMIGESNQARAFLSLINNKRNNIKTLMISAKVDIIKKYVRVKGDMEITIIFPDKILIKTSVLGFQISKLLINGNKLYFKDNIKNTLRVRRATKRNISRYIPIELSLNQFKQMLKGMAPIINYRNIQINANKTKLTLKNNIETQYIIFDKNKDILEMNLYQNNKKRVEIKFSKIKYKNGYNYASKISFKDYKKEMKSKMEIVSIQFNKNVNPKLFSELKKKIN